MFNARKYCFKKYIHIQSEFETDNLFSKMSTYLLRNAISVSLRYFGGLETHPPSDSLVESSSSVDICCLLKLVKARDSFSSFIRLYMISFPVMLYYNLLVVLYRTQ